MSEEEKIEKVEEKKSFGSRVLGWIINLVLLGALAYWIIGLKADQKKKFYQNVADTAKAECQENAACIENLKAHFNECAADYSSSRKKGKFNREYTLDKEGFDECLNAYKE